MGKKRPSNSLRLGRPEAEREPKRAQNEERKSRLAVWSDMLGRWHTFRTPPQEVLMSAVPEVWLELESRVSQGQGQVSVLELGCGSGNSLAFLKARHGPRVRVVGQVLERTIG